MRLEITRISLFQFSMPQSSWMQTAKNGVYRPSRAPPLGYCWWLLVMLSINDSLILSSNASMTRCAPDGGPRRLACLQPPFAEAPASSQVNRPAGSFPACSQTLACVGLRPKHILAGAKAAIGDTRVTGPMTQPIFQIPIYTAHNDQSGTNVHPTHPRA